MWKQIILQIVSAPWKLSKAFSGRLRNIEKEPKSYYNGLSEDLSETIVPSFVPRLVSLDFIFMNI